MNSGPVDGLPDIRDGLTRKQRIILYCLHQLQIERGGKQVPSAMLYGRVIEFMNMSVEEFQEAISDIAKPE